MRTNDQYFQPGDKVMRVAFGAAPNSRVVFEPMSQPRTGTEFGKVLCVATCYQCPFDGASTVTFVGVDSSPPYIAANFRKVSEIQLCVRAAKRLSDPAETETQSA